MKYLLDFDGVIFNTELLKLKIKQVQSQTLTAEDNLSFLHKVATTDCGFDFKDLVFPDAWDFIKKHQKDCFVVSSAYSSNKAKNTDFDMQKRFQTEKIKLSGVWDLVNEVFVTLETKISALQNLKSVFAGNELIFLDDSLQHLNDASTLGIKPVLMQRINYKKDVDFKEKRFIVLENRYKIPVVKNFSEFSNLLNLDRAQF